jgi:hypothetical protein
MSELKINCIDSPEDFINMGRVYEDGNTMYVSIETPGEEEADKLMCNIFIGKAEAIKIIDHLKTQYNL